LKKYLFIANYDIYLPVESSVAGAMRGGETVCGLHAEETSEKMKDCANKAQQKGAQRPFAGRLVRRIPHWFRHPAWLPLPYFMTDQIYMIVSEINRDFA